MLATPCAVFIVEDDELLANALKVQVDMFGYSVVGSADTAEAAVSGILAAEPDVIIMDVNLGAGGSGLEAARSVRLRSKVPIIFYTAHNDAIFHQKVATLENTSVLEKPVTEETLGRALSSACAQSKGLALVGPCPELV